MPVPATPSATRARRENPPRAPPRPMSWRASFVSPFALALCRDPAGLRTERAEKLIEDIGQVVGRDAVDHELSALLLVHQARRLERRQVLGDGRCRHVELGCDLAHRHGSAREMIEDAAARLAGDGLERFAHRYFPK